MNTITIDIKRSLSARKFKEEERIHQAAFNRACKLIDGQLKEIMEDDALSNDETDCVVEGGVRSRKYGTISVFGDRGVGKTSFLLSIRDKYSRDANIAILPFIDPTLIEEKGHVFLLVVGILEEMVTSELSMPNHADAYERHLSEWRKIKKELSKGIPSLAKIGLTYQEPQWQEDEYIMDKGIESVQAAFHLETNFHLLIDKALDIMGKKALMMFFDDIDVDFKKGWSVLECIRKYLTSPKLIVVMSGNMKLYSKNVRRHQWENFGKAILINEVENNAEKIEEYTRLVNEIEGQYFMKILKSENRIYLYSLADNMRMADFVIKVQEEEEKAICLDAFYKKHLRKYGIIGNGSSDVFTQFLLKTSMRTQAHLMYQLQNGSDNLLSSISPFTSRMYAQEIDVDGALRAEQINNVVLHYLVERQLVEEAYQLTPNFENQDVNSAVTGFTILFAQLVGRTPSLIFDYLIKVGCTRNYMHHLSYSKDSDTWIGRFCQGASIYQSRDLQSIYGNGIAYLQSVNPGIPNYSEKEIYSYSEKAKKGQQEEKNRIDDVLKDVDGITQLLGYMPLISMLYGHKNERSLRYSFYVILANIGQLLKSRNEEDMIQALTEACQVRNYQMLSKGQNAGEQNEAEIDFELNFDNESLLIVAREMLAWKESFKELNLTIAPLLLGRINTRFYYSTSNISSGTRGRKLGDYMSLLVMSFLNSVIIEECRECRTNNFGLLNTSNVQTSSKVLKDNLMYLSNNAKDEANKLTIPLSGWLLACPIFNAFLDQQISGQIADLLNIEEDDRIPYMRSISGTIDQILIKKQ